MLRESYTPIFKAAAVSLGNIIPKYARQSADAYTKAAFIILRESWQYYAKIFIYCSMQDSQFYKETIYLEPVVKRR